VREFCLCAVRSALRTLSSPATRTLSSPLSSLPFPPFLPFQFPSSSSTLRTTHTFNRLIERYHFHPPVCCLVWFCDHVCCSVLLS
jgi:hypothetical protein